MNPNTNEQNHEASGRERRKYERFNVKLDMIAWSLRHPQITLYAKSLNISQGGLLFNSIANFRIGETICVKLEFKHALIIEKKGRVLRKIQTVEIDADEEHQLDLHTYAFEFISPIEKDAIQKIVFGLPGEALENGSPNQSGLKKSELPVKE